MGDFGLNQTFEYSEISFDSWDASSQGGTLVPSTASDKYSWPLFQYTSKRTNVAAIKILQAEIPFVWDVINLVNNTFIYTASGTPNTITIPTGTYTATNLATTLTTLISAITPGFTVTYSSTTLRLTFTQSAAIAWTLGFASRNTAYSPLGFLPSGTYQATGVGSTIVSANVVQVSGPNYLYVNSRRIGSLINFNLTDGAPKGPAGPQIAKIPVNVPYGSVIYYNDPGTILFNRP